MQTETVINKVVITDEAIFDYEEITFGLPMPKADIKSESETYMENMQKSSRLLCGYYFRAKYYDEAIDKMLMLFFYKGIKLGSMQMWKLSGICEADDWTREAEEVGQIRVWLNSRLVPEDKGDWVWDLRLWQEKQKAMTELSENEYYGEDYGKMVKELLKNYKLNKTKIAVGLDSTDSVGLVDRMTFLDICIANLDDEERELLTDIYIKGMSLSRTGKKYGYVKSAISKKRDRAVGIIEILFRERYELKE